MHYFIGIVMGITGGLINYFGQILQKKAINRIKTCNNELEINRLIKNSIWLIGFSLMFISTFLLFGAQYFIGPALIPGLAASGFIVLSIGSVKILHEKIKTEEIIAICLLIAGIVLISFSKLSIEGNIMNFSDKNFVFRIIIVSIVLLILWLTIYYCGKRSRQKTIFMAFAAGLPFIIANIWTLPLILGIQSISDNAFLNLSVLLIAISITLISFTNILGMIHMQKALATSNANIVIPIQQIPQQLSPILIYFYIYALSSPDKNSFRFFGIGLILILSAGFILSKRQAKTSKECSL